jgi:hypothetical protein
VKKLMRKKTLGKNAKIGRGELFLLKSIDKKIKNI